MESATRRRLRTIEALLRLCIAMAAIRLLPIRWLLPDTADHHERADDAPQDRNAALAVRGAIRSATARLPIKPKCLAQSLAAAAMLRSRGIAHQLRIGARNPKEFEAHAWVEAGSVVVAGEGDVDSYSVLLTRER